MRPRPEKPEASTHLPEGTGVVCRRSRTWCWSTEHSKSLLSAKLYRKTSLWN